MRKHYDIPDCPIADDIPDADPAQLLPLVREFISRDGEPDSLELTLTLLIRFLAVYHYKEVNDGEEVSGWMVCGNVPYLGLNDDELKTPMEALFMYAWQFRSWLAAKGQGDDIKVPIYRVPPDWKPLTFSPGYEDWQVGVIMNYINWKLLQPNEKEIIHPELREICEAHGWIRYDV